MNSKKERRQEISIMLFLGLVFVTFFVAGLFLLWVGIHELRGIGSDSDWATTEAEVTGFTVTELENPDFGAYEEEESIRRGIPRKVFGTQIEYVYFVSDTRHTGSGMSGRTYESRYSAESAKPAQVVRVYYQSGAPSVNSLYAPAQQRKDAWQPIILGPIMMLPLIGALALWIWMRVDGGSKSSRVCH